MTKLQGEPNPTNDVFKMGEGNPLKPLDAVKNASSRSLAGGIDTVNDLAATSTNLIATPAPLVNSPVLIIGAGLLGASIGLALSRAGVPVWLEASSPTGLDLACDLGAGQPLSAQPAPAPALVVVATPPDVAGDVVVHALRNYPGAVVTDVASVKEPIAKCVLERVPNLAQRYVGSHPMAGRERSGAASARADLFDARPWVLVATPATSPNALSAVRQLAIDLGALPTQLGAAEHDRAVALISHTPQLVASALAARLEQAPEMALNLAGQGLRDTTRIAASDPRLWAAILNANRSSVSQVLRELRVDIDALIEALEQGRGSVGTVVDVMQRGNLGRDRIPGKHGGAPSRYAEVMVLIPDAPGQLARLFNDVGAAQVNIEDLVIEHSAGQRQGLATLLVAPAAAVGLRQALEQQGWKIVAN